MYELIFAFNYTVLSKSNTILAIVIQSPGGHNVMS